MQATARTRLRNHRILVQRRREGQLRGSVDGLRTGSSPLAAQMTDGMTRQAAQLA
jgi:hypothetical protein